MATDKESDSIVVGVIEKLVHRVEAFERTIADRQKTFEDSLFQQFVALRKDIFESVLDLRVKYDAHDAKHQVDDQRRETDALMRAHRQFTMNLVLAGIVVLLIIGFIAIGGIVLWAKVGT